jgi:exosortase/archaeosortase family protein
LSAAGATASAARRSPSAGSLCLPFKWTFAALVALTAVGFARSYVALLPLAGSESPESLLLLIPAAATVVLWTRLRYAARDGEELTVNLLLGSPALLVLLALLLWFPARLSYFYWVYRFDLLAVPVFVSLAVLILYGAKALWNARLAIALLALGWPPLLDKLLALVTARAASVQASIIALLPLGAVRNGESFFVGHGRSVTAITIGAPCSGLLGAMSMLLVGGLVVHFARGARARKLAWLAVAVALAMIVNVVRLALVVGVAASSGVHAGFQVFHALSGVVLFALTLFAALLLLRPFGLQFARRATAEPARPVELKTPIATAVAAVVVVLAVVSWWSIGDGVGAGLFRSAPTITQQDLLPAPRGLERSKAEPLQSFGPLFGDGALAAVFHLRGPQRLAAAAQVVVVPSYGQAQRYGPLQCFVFHRYRIYATHVAPLVDGGTGVLTAFRLDGSDVATLTWIQPVQLNGQRAWRRVLLFAYLRGSPSGASGPAVSSARSFGNWLLDRLGPYGGSSPPARFRLPERGLVALANRLVAPITST